MITLQKSDNKTETMKQILQLKLDQVIPEDNHKDTTYHMTIRKQRKPLYTTDNEFTKEEVRSMKV
jgi:hypothetical protein